MHHSPGTAMIVPMKLRYTIMALLFLPMSLAVADAGAEEFFDPAEQAIMDNIRAKLNALRPDLPLGNIKPTVVEGYYEIQVGGQLIHTTAEVDHLFLSDLFVFQDGMLVNLSESSRLKMRKRLLESVDEAQMLVFAPPQDKVKATITVFTDIDCGYCRKLHAEVPEMNRLGIAVRYLAYPRAGPGSVSYQKAVSAWCADNPRTALTMAKQGREIETRTCANPVAEHMALGIEVGVNGTPAIIYENGTLQGGYLPAIQMAARLGLVSAAEANAIDGET